MNDQKTFCEECRSDRTFLLEEILMSSKLKSEVFSYLGKRATCSECGSEVYVAQIEDENLKTLYNTYRLKNGIISLEKIEEIPQKYNIGKRPLSLLLGWGEMTFSRYCDGDMPTKQYSDVLLKIYDDPGFYTSLLEENKNKLSSSAAYDKSKRYMTELLEKNKERAKVDDVIDYLLSQCEDITPLALQKALYYIQGFYYAFMGGFLFIEDCEAWVHGPVYRDIFIRYSSYHYDPINSSSVYDISVFTDSEKAIIDSVILNFCCYSGKILERFTHSEMPWLQTRGNLMADVPSDRIISKSIIGEYFSAIKKKYKMLSPHDIEQYAKVMFSRSMKC